MIRDMAVVVSMSVMVALGEASWRGGGGGGGYHNDTTYLSQ